MVIQPAALTQLPNTFLALEEEIWGLELPTEKRLKLNHYITLIPTANSIPTPTPTAPLKEPAMPLPSAGEASKPS